MSTIFISYASEDRDLAEDIYHALEGAGHNAYLDKKDLIVGKEYNIAIRELVDASDFFVFLISPESVRQGSYALTELSYAEDRWRKRPEDVVPVMVRPVEPHQLPSFLRQVTYLYPRGNTTAEIISELNKRLRLEIGNVEQSREQRGRRAKGYIELSDQIRWFHTMAYRNRLYHRSLYLFSALFARHDPDPQLRPIPVGTVGDCDLRRNDRFFAGPWPSWQLPGQTPTLPKRGGATGE